VAEGVRLCEEALKAGWRPRYVFYSDHLSERGHQLLEQFRNQGLSLLHLSDSLMQQLAETETPQGILCVLPMHHLPFPKEWDFILVLDGIKDPGNAGSILRTAWAAGVQAVFFTPGTTDLFAPKVVRAGMGAHFHLPLFQAPWEEIARVIKASPGAALYLADVRGGKSLWQYDLRQPLALAIGSEAEGFSPEAKRWADGIITIPMPGQSESLNAASAAAILLFEVVRQRQIR